MVFKFSEGLNKLIKSTRRTNEEFVFTLRNAILYNPRLYNLHQINEYNPETKSFDLLSDKLYYNTTIKMDVDNFDIKGLTEVMKNAAGFHKSNTTNNMKEKIKINIAKRLSELRKEIKIEDDIIEFYGLNLKNQFSIELLNKDGSSVDIETDSSFVHDAVVDVVVSIRYMSDKGIFSFYPKSFRLVTTEYVEPSSHADYAKKARNGGIFPTRGNLYTEEGSKQAKESWESTKAIKSQSKPYDYNTEIDDEIPF